MWRAHDKQASFAPRVHVERFKADNPMRAYQKRKEISAHTLKKKDDERSYTEMDV